MRSSTATDTPEVDEFGLLSKAPREDEANVRANRVEISWTTPPMEGQPPSARGGHSAVLVDTQLLIFGGHFFGGHGSFVYLNDLHRLDLETSTWHEIPFKERDVVVPRPRYNHSALLMNGNTRMFVFGGRGENAQVIRDMFFLDLDQVAWFQVQWTTDCPLGRFGHGCASVDDQNMLFFGGWDGKKSMNDLWSFDTNTFTWHKPKCTGKPPTPRQDHSMLPIATDLVMVYGGYTVLPEALPAYNKDIFLLDTETLSWSRPRLTGEYPLGTFGQTVCLQNELALLLGGWSGTERTPLYMGDKQVKELVNMLAREDRLVSGQETRSSRKENTKKLKSSSSYTRVLDVTRMQWYPVVSHGVVVSNRYGHTCTIVGPHLFIFGGWDGNRALNQLVVGEVSTS
ncbi:hypothetical protein Poli38472_005350 [Pythium oligandrum]|uniref:Kelch repeat-containing protein n=1 Tax=Pythium oligandrum TaxID=41045 RepID=A0A8K1FKE0_PYTOL|nr:hypothetical protein Poli38472_005350 [Pythium oligandrum]|eukprot:TMW62732.1 hypothetical protein Poli38472_005350 [Pythium oligandrum]